VSLTAEDAETAEGKKVRSIAFPRHGGDLTEAERLNRITESIIGCAVTVHKALGPGLLESAYEACLAFELAQMGLKVEREKPLPVTYKQVRLDCAYRLDLLVEHAVIVEIKVVERLAPIHTAQLLSYLKLSGCKVGLLINFHVQKLTDGVRRIVNGFPGFPEPPQ
jgi:GxxExxY protein